MASAAIDAYTQYHPDDAISLLGTPLTLSVFDAASSIHERIILDRKSSHAGFSGMVRVAGELYRKQFDTGILLTNSFSSALVYTMARIPRRIGYAGQWKTRLLTDPVKPMAPGTHQAVKYANLLIGTPNIPLQPKIELREEEIKAAKEYLLKLGVAGQMIIGIAAGASYGSAKCWPGENYAALASYCAREMNAAILLFGSKQEAPLIEEIQRNAGNETYSLAGKTGFRELFAILNQCTLVIANDSGVMHATTAVGTPVIGIFGPTSVKETGPLGDSTVIIQKHLPCAPCFKRKCPLKHHDCMKQISVREVYAAITNYLEKQSIGFT